MSKITNYLSLSLKVAIPVVAVMFGADAFAAEVKTVGGQLGNVQNDVSALGSFFKLCVALAGIYWVFKGIQTFIKHSEDERQYPTSKAVIYCVCGALALGITAVAEMLTGSTTDSTIEESEVFEVQK